jgi:pSer/pThr/pTyr-binding forkhead associated (FHA) protein
MIPANLFFGREVMSGVKAYLYSEHRWIDLPEGELIIGRSASCHCSIDDDTVSWNHLRLVVQGNSVAVEDLDSTNGTRINGKPLGNGPGQLVEGDLLQCGRVIFVIRTAGPLRGVLSFLSRLLRGRRRSAPAETGSHPAAA